MSDAPAKEQVARKLKDPRGALANAENMEYPVCVDPPKSLREIGKRALRQVLNLPELLELLAPPFVVPERNLTEFGLDGSCVARCEREWQQLCRLAACLGYLAYLMAEKKSAVGPCLALGIHTPT